MIKLDGSDGEGGGQILRTALSLSMITGTPFRIDNIRAKRRLPGLLRQHLTCVKAAQSICRAKVSGGELGSSQLTFTPGTIRGGDYTFAIGTAGSTTLVFQTVFPALLAADVASTMTISGGTHNPAAPTFDYLARVFRPLLKRMGADFELTLNRHGFFPAGGGSFTAQIAPAKLSPLIIDTKGEPLEPRVIADVANVPYEVAEREIAMATTLMGWAPEVGAARTVHADCPGNVVMIELTYANVREMFSSFGERQLTAEAVVAQAVEAARAYLSAGVPVGPHLADQLLLPMALADGGLMVTMRPTDHTKSNCAVIERFLDVVFDVTEEAPNRWRVGVS